MKYQWLLLLFLGMASAVPTPKMCAKFAKFVEEWNPLPETLLTWSRSKHNCDKIQPRPHDMTCEDIQRFIADCNYGGGGPAAKDSKRRGPVLATANSEVMKDYYQRTYGNYPRVLGKYIHYNAETVRDFGQFGNWYYPNYYPPAYLGWFDGRQAGMAQLENDYRFAKGGHYPYNRADNIVNIGLQQTSLPTCLHDLFYCVRAQNPTPYESYYDRRQAERQRQRIREEKNEEAVEVEEQ